MGEEEKKVAENEAKEEKPKKKESYMEARNRKQKEHLKKLSE